MAETLRSKEEQVAALELDLSKLKAELDSIPSYRSEERQRVQVEIDRVQSHLDSIKNAPASEKTAEQAKKAELSVGDMVKLVIEFNDLKKTQSELNPAHSDRQRIQTELDKISAELKQNNVDTDNRFLMALVDANHKMAQELSNLRSGQGNSEADQQTNSELPKQEETKAETIKQNTDDLRLQIVELNGKIEELRDKAKKKNADAASLLSELVAKVGEMKTSIEGLTDGDDKAALLSQWEVLDYDSQLEEIKKSIEVKAAEPKSETETPATDESNTEVADAANAQESGESAAEGGATETLTEAQPAPSETESTQPRWKQLWGKIRGAFTSFIRSASSREESSETNEATDTNKSENVDTFANIESTNDAKKRLKEAEKLYNRIVKRFPRHVSRGDFAAFRQVARSLDVWRSRIEGDKLTIMTNDEKADLLGKVDAVKAKWDKISPIMAKLEEIRFPRAKVAGPVAEVTAAPEPPKQSGIELARRSLTSLKDQLAKFDIAGMKDADMRPVFAFALNALYYVDQEQVNNPAFNLTDEERGELRGQMDEVKKLLSEKYKVSWDNLLPVLKTASEGEADTDARFDKRGEKLEAYLNANFPLNEQQTANADSAETAADEIDNLVESMNIE